MGLSLADVGGDLVVALALGAAVGGAGGWVLGGRRAAARGALAAFAISLGPGHNIPALGGLPVVPKELAILAAVLAVGSVVLVEGCAVLGDGVGRERAGRSGPVAGARPDDAPGGVQPSGMTPNPTAPANPRRNTPKRRAASGPSSARTS
jgi:hypothetical protein